MLPGFQSQTHRPGIKPRSLSCGQGHIQCTEQKTGLKIISWLLQGVVSIDEYYAIIPAIKEENAGKSIRSNKLDRLADILLPI